MFSCLMDIQRWDGLIAVNYAARAHGVKYDSQEFHFEWKEHIGSDVVGKNVFVCWEASTVLQLHVDCRGEGWGLQMPERHVPTSPWCMWKPSAREPRRLREKFGNRNELAEVCLFQSEDALYNIAYYAEMTRWLDDCRGTVSSKREA